MARSPAEIEAEIHQHVHMIGALEVNHITNKRPHIDALTRLSDELKAAREVAAAVEAAKPAPNPEVAKPAPNPAGWGEKMARARALTTKKHAKRGKARR